MTFTVGGGGRFGFACWPFGIWLWTVMTSDLPSFESTMFRGIAPAAGLPSFVLSIMLTTLPLKLQVPEVDCVLPSWRPPETTEVKVWSFLRVSVILSLLV